MKFFRNLSTPLFASLAALFLYSSLGCAPVIANSRMDDAFVAIERARASGADEHAPYEYYKARYYYYMAEEEWGYANYSTAWDYAAVAKKAAEVATIKVKEDPWKGSPADEKITPASLKDKGLTNKMLGVNK